MEVSSSKKMYPLDTDLSRVWHLLDRRYTASASLQSDCNQRKRAENCSSQRGPSCLLHRVCWGVCRCVKGWGVLFIPALLYFCRNISANVTDSRPTQLLEVSPLRKRREAEMKMLRFSLGVTGIDRIRSESLRGADQVRCLGDKSKEADWDYLDTERRNSDDVTKRKLRLEKPGKGLEEEQRGGSWM